MSILIYSRNITLSSYMKGELHGGPTCEAYPSYEREGQRLSNNFPLSTRAFVDFMPYDYHGHNGPIMRGMTVFIMEKEFAVN